MTVPSELETSTPQDLETQANGALPGGLRPESPALEPGEIEQANAGAIPEPVDLLHESEVLEQVDVIPEKALPENGVGDRELSPADNSDSAIAAESTSPEVEELTDDDDELPDEVEMSLFDHLEELRTRIFYALIAMVVGAIGCFAFVKPIVQLLEVPAQGVKFLQLAPGEFFFVSIKVAGYCGILVATPVILYQIVAFVLPGLTRRERRFLAPVVFGSSILFVAGLAFAYIALIPAALNFFISYGADVVEQSWSIEKYFDFVLLLMLSTGLAFQVPIIQALLGFLGIVSSKQMLSGWKFVLLASAVIGAVLTPSTDPLTQSLLGGAITTLYFGGIGLVKLLGK
jgi:sec-independent protein translocase protein TatC